jgi:hypothetical protein
MSSSLRAQVAQELGAVAWSLDASALDRACDDITQARSVPTRLRDYASDRGERHRDWNAR